MTFAFLLVLAGLAVFFGLIVACVWVMIRDSGLPGVMSDGLYWYVGMKIGYLWGRAWVFRTFAIAAVLVIIGLVKKA